jgi:hypothetical protein
METFKSLLARHAALSFEKQYELTDYIMTNPVRAALRGRPGLASQDSASRHPFSYEDVATTINKPPAGVKQPYPSVGC